jgi:hypothetical protein
VRGTVQHEVLESDDTLAYQDGTALEFVVTCRAAAGTLDGAVLEELAEIRAEEAGPPRYFP